ncbi:unnamed protein product [Rotaria sp. Silwood2]|nr:unnamed protein product [Rotaria sp. Silwood2]
MYVADVCAGLFIDNNNTLYCSQWTNNVIVKGSLDKDANASMIAAGNGTAGSASNLLSSPIGIFVDINFNLYVADAGNNRIQLFQFGQLNAITVAGDGASINFALDYPTGVVLDADNYLFIVDQNNNRIIRWGPNGVRCLFGCSHQSGLGSDELRLPWGLAFDSYGNVFVTDWRNGRIQKFSFINKSCAPSINQPKLCASASWDTYGVTVVDNSTIGSSDFDIFIDNNNTVYVTDQNTNSILVLSERNGSSIAKIFNNISFPNSIFVTIDGDIYVNHGYSNGQVDKWSFNMKNSITVLLVDEPCSRLFLDINNTVYCSQKNYHLINKCSIDDYGNTSVIAAGNGTAGSASNLLSSPIGIFVDINFNLYVADAGNNRIQLFQFGQLNAITVAGDGASINFALDYPTTPARSNLGTN